MYYVANEWEPGTVEDRGVPDLVEPAYAQNSSLATHVEGLQAIKVGLVNCPCLGGVEQYWDVCHLLLRR